MRSTFIFFLTIALIIAAIAGCSSGTQESGSGGDEEQPELVRKYRDDGTLSSVTQVDEKGYAHGIKVNYYEDGKTVHSKVSYQHGRKHGPAIWYFRSGQIYEQTSFHFGRRDGVTKRYYEDGTLMEEITFEQGEEQPGKKVYDRDGTLITE
ncbi:MAG TPA: hypothetical protein ENO20_03505 [Bacteroides sp.]|nr:hypothetical protein [Bacteroides sp.]